MRILGELATLVLCLKDGISIENIQKYVCPSIIPILEIENLERALATLFDGKLHSYAQQEQNIFQVLGELEKNSLEKLIAITSIISALPLNKEETLELMIPKELVLDIEKRNVTQSENITSQTWETVSYLQ